MKHPNLSGLYGITDTTLMPDDAILLSAVGASLAGGMRVLQYRDKSDNHIKRRRQAQALQQLCAQYKVPLLINDDVVLAQAIGAAGVHLGQTDGSIEQARHLLGPDALIGVTCHDRLELAEQAAAAGANYLAFGRFFPSQTKPQAAPADLEILQAAKQQFNLPLVAIGGITLERAPKLIAQGADMLAVIHDLFASPAIKQKAKAYSALFTQERGQ